MLRDKMKKLTEHNRIIKNIVWKELETLELGKYIEFKWGRKLFIIRRKK